MKEKRAVIFGCHGPALLPAEREFFGAVRPAGFILFSRNCTDPNQLAGLTASLRAAIDDPEAPILIDQEGGRVVRLGPPHWRHPPAAAAFARRARTDRDAALRAAGLNARMIAWELTAAGINVDCAPVLDLPQFDADPIIGDRAYGDTPAMIAELARAVCDGLLAEGVLPVIKHIPGHGRARVDSHKALPRVEAPRAELSATDFEPFRQLSDMPIAMTAHVVFGALDSVNPATTSAVVIRDAIREEIGFQGLLLSDDLSMNALARDFTARATGAIGAGCDIVLHCNGDMTEMKAVAAGTPILSERGRDRLHSALNRINDSRSGHVPPDMLEAEKELAALLRN